MHNCHMWLLECAHDVSLIREKESMKDRNIAELRELVLHDVGPNMPR